MKLSIETKININAQPEQVWKVFSDFKSYPDWNPFISKLEGKVIVNQHIFVKLPGMNFKPKVERFDPLENLTWKGKLFIKGLFDGRHYFQLIPEANGTTTFIHGEDFSGILVFLFKKNLLTEIKDGFNNMNKALKERVESNL
ncbi:SRPBCC domain-containing protein [Crocinitomix algicola]|uniref:SRPBCC domain-containing protein n=1 Tax=Crocinitomix algicola TaxID=1740263 RepID=UPI000871FDEC|nr:SRPBCC domain-containing protein [Crocinitomix algicola]